jgi:hypothetical protein
MSNLILPASCYEEALPDLRAPYLPTQIRPLIIQAPKNGDMPCRVALYTIGETLMDRFNLCCAGNWEVVFTVETHKETPKQSDGETVTIHYFKIVCSLTVFGNEHHDKGEGEGANESLAEFNARAQAFKRAARWHGPGQCLYVFGGEDFVMWRGPEKGKLHIPKSGNEPHRKPFFDNASKQAVRDEYAKWLKNEGEGQFGVPLNHMEIAEAIRSRSLHRPLMAVPDLSRALPDLTPAATGRIEPADSQETPERALPAPQTTQAPRHEAVGGGEKRPPRPPAPARQDVARLPMPDVPASQEAVEIAVSGGFNATVAHALSNLARSDAQEGNLSERQHKTVVNWLIILSELHLTSDEIVEAVQFVGENGTGQERRQATFSRWLAGKASGQLDAPAAPVNTEATADVDGSEPADSAAAPEAADPAAVETARALTRIRATMNERGYPDRTVALLAKLSIGLPPKRSLQWAKVPPATMTVLAELLESASTIDWSPQLLGREVLAAHGSKSQNTPAGRFSAFAGHLTELAEARRLDEAA